MGVNVTPYLPPSWGHRALTQRSISPPLIHVYVSMRLINTPRHQLGEVGCNVDSCIIMNKKANVLRTAGHCISHIPSVHNKGREHWTSSILHVLCVYKVTWLWCMRTWPRQRPGKTLFLLTMKNGCQFSKIFSNILPECSLLVSSFLVFFPVQHSSFKHSQTTPPITLFNSNVLISPYLNYWHVTFKTVIPHCIYCIRYSYLYYYYVLLAIPIMCFTSREASKSDLVGRFIHIICKCKDLGVVMI